MRTKYNRIQVDLSNHGTSNVNEDIKRLKNLFKVFINDTPLEKHESYETLMGKDTADRFFSAALLTKLDAQINKEEVKKYLNQYFHQGALLHPASANLNNQLHHSIGLTISAHSAENTKEISIHSTKHGFELSESVRIMKLQGPVDAKYPDKLRPFISNSELSIELENGDPTLPVIEAKVTIKLDFSEPEKPKLKVLENQLTCRVIALEPFIDARTLARKIIDFFLELFGLLNEEELKNPGSNGFFSETESSDDPSTPQEDELPLLPKGVI